MGVELVIRDLIADIDQLKKLYGQLYNVPQEVQELFDLLANSRQLLALSIARLSKVPPQIDPGNEFFAGKPFSRFRSKLLDLELFLDPRYQLHQSGPRSEARNVVPWAVTDDHYIHDTCQTFQTHLSRLDDDCQTLFSFLQSPNIPAIPDDAVSQASSSPSLAPSEYSVDSGTSTPNGTRRPRPKRIPNHLKTEEQKIMDRFVAQYSGSAAGSKRKRPSRERRKRSDQPAEGLGAISELFPHAFPSPIANFTISPTSSPGLSPYLDGTNPTWLFDDIRNSLPPNSGSGFAPTIPRNKGKRPVQPDVYPRGLGGPAESSSSSSGSFRSMPISREGSIFTVASKDRVFEEGTTRLWHQNRGTLQQLPIEHIEVRRLDRIKGEGVVIVSKTPSGQEVLDDLWMPSIGTNSSPFLENSDVVTTFRQREESANFVVCFAPNPNHHPQYSFSTKEDCWDFMQAITDKTLCASLDIESIKSACTHGNAVESGCETIQVWEDQVIGLRTVKLFRNKNPHAKEKVVEMDVNCFRFPEKEKRTGKLVFGFRDAQDGPTKEMKYLKIGFSNADAEEGFLQQVGFSTL